MLCNVCFRMLRGQEGRIWKGTYDLHFTHHSAGKELRRSALINCGICRVLFEELQTKVDHTLVFDDLELLVTASLSVLDHPRVQHLYRLDFKLRCNRIRSQRTFVLKRTASGDPPFRTPISHSTSSDEVYQLSRRWMSKCRCADTERPPSWYPARLISLEQLKTKDFLDTRRLISTNQRGGDDLDDTLVKLVEKEDWENPNEPPHGDVRYVTLSHCWGSSGNTKLMLTSKNIKSLKQGIRLCDLPRTFRDAVEFAARLPRVGYIWIDSLCIKQGYEDREDWLLQSATMHKVYSETFLNISASAASNSEMGLFFPRRPELLLEDEVILNIEGIPGVKSSSLQALEVQLEPLTEEIRMSFVQWLDQIWLFSCVILLMRAIVEYLDVQLATGEKIAIQQQFMEHSRRLSRMNSVRTPSTRDSSPSRESDLGESVGGNDTKNLRRCTILDVSFWKNTVDKAPVNTRGWVLQERLMSPRVLHFCHDQVAWECGEFDAAEGQPQGMPNFQLTSDGIVEESRLKGLDPRTDGKRLRRIRLQGYDDPDPHMQPQVFALELWKRIVEVYSRTAVSNPEDKLIALSGMARWMASKIGTKEKPAEYVAGLWKDYLASQLLWRVEPIFQGIDGNFKHPSTRPGYRAPSWSWASIDADKDHGIAYAEITDRDLCIQVENFSIKPKFKANPYGLIESGHLFLRGKLRKASLHPKPKGRFGWRLIGRESLDDEEHTNVYLDCPSSDGEGIFGPDANVYVVPAAWGERTASPESKYLICLLIQLVKEHSSGPAFRRIGLTKLSPWADSRALNDEKILESYNSDVDMPHQGYDAMTGEHTILML
ncbi:HET-domain-containing protein [Corynespora cassiicola Philippines]|uniref:HET-domain-containing protein n=1 Tax=Corynespora cassiicola Philippines TaxID=1448308 RepID=A0A2T2NWW2_CORCC|nr:HET-domain-containing protein [Corynespora cassiicola Philippines]